MTLAALVLWGCSEGDCPPTSLQGDVLNADLLADTSPEGCDAFAAASLDLRMPRGRAWAPIEGEPPLTCTHQLYLDPEPRWLEQTERLADTGCGEPGCIYRVVTVRDERDGTRTITDSHVTLGDGVEYECTWEYSLPPR